MEMEKEEEREEEEKGEEKEEEGYMYLEQQVSFDVEDANGM